MPWGDDLREESADEPAARRRFRSPAFLLLVGLTAGVTGWWTADRIGLPWTSDLHAEAVLPGEFERHEGLLLGWSPSGTPAQQRVVAAIAREVSGRVDLYILVEDEHGRLSAEASLREMGVERVQFIEAPRASTWTRDLGFRISKSLDGTLRTVVFPNSNPRDLETARILARRFGTARPALSLRSDGGNLMVNGAGFGVATTLMNFRNTGQPERDSVASTLTREFGLNQLVFLEPLAGEPTRHIDMFLTFADCDLVILGEYREEDDADNAEILDRNARRLAGMKTACGPLRVLRVPMPPRTREGHWRSYTNVVFVNGLLLFPRYEDVDPAIEARALSVYRDALPGWEIRAISADGLSSQQGSLHCATLNLYQIRPADFANQDLAGDRSETPKM